MVRVGEISSDIPLTKKEEGYLQTIKENNKTHIVDPVELKVLIKQAGEVYKRHFDKKVWFERSIFTNWTCGIADCKYCYLSTKPKLAKNAIRSQASILAEALVLREMDWGVGYITGGLRVEKTEQIVELLKRMEIILGHKIMMNYGPYTKKEVEQFAPYITGMGSAVESFDEELHKFICPSKPLPALLNYLGYLQELNLKKLITIILGIGEKMSDIDTVIAYVKKYDITYVQLCFLKPQEYTVFDDVPSPNPDYMAWWAAKLRIACPELILKVALVKDRITDFSLMLDAGVNCFSRYLVFNDFASPFALELQAECKKAGRELVGNFIDLPKVDFDESVKDMALDADLKADIVKKAKRYYARLEKVKRKFENAT